MIKPFMLNTSSPVGDFHRVAVPAAGTPSTGLATAAVGVVVVASLYFGRDGFVPMARAVLLSFALGPAVLLLRRWHVNRVFAGTAVVALSFVLILAIGAAIGTQLAHFAEDLPGYQFNVTEKIHSLRASTTGSGVVGRAVKTLSDLGTEITKTPEEEAGTAASNLPVRAPDARQQKPTAQQQQPLPVEIRQSAATPLQLIMQVAAPLLQPLATAGIVIVFVLFFLL